MDAVLFLLDGRVRMSAEDAMGVPLACMAERATRHFCRHAQPARVQPIEHARKRVSLEIQLLQPEVGQRSEQVVEADVVDDEAIELMAMDGNVTQPVVFPRILLKYLDPDQVRHDVGEAVIVVALDPYDFDVALGIRKLADGAEELPVFFLEAPEVEVGKDVAEQNEAAEGGLLQ